MNPWQMSQQIKHLLQTVTWPGGSAEVVFGSKLRVNVFAGTPTEEQIPPAWPWCLIVIESGSADDSHPELLTQTFELNTGVEVAGDPMGEQAIIGGSTADLGKSASRGIAEVVERVRAAVGNLTGVDGATVILSETSISTPRTISRGGRHLVVAADTLTAVCTTGLYYAAPQELRVAGASFVWQGAHCSDRFDFVKYRMFSKVGTTPATSPDDADATLVYTGTAATTVLDGDTGTTYTVFADYSARKQTGVVEGSSDPDVGAYLAVT